MISPCFHIPKHKFHIIRIFESLNWHNMCKPFSISLLNDFTHQGKIEVGTKVFNYVFCFKIMQIKNFHQHFFLFIFSTILEDMSNLSIIRISIITIARCKDFSDLIKCSIIKILILFNKRNPTFYPHASIISHIIKFKIGFGRC